MTLLKKNKGNISHAAREADIDRKYFRKLMQKYGIEGGDADDERADDTAPSSLTSVRERPPSRRRRRRNAAEPTPPPERPSVHLALVAVQLMFASLAMVGQAGAARAAAVRADRARATAGGGAGVPGRLARSAGRERVERARPAGARRLRLLRRRRQPAPLHRRACSAPPPPTPWSSARPSRSSPSAWRSRSAASAPRSAKLVGLAVALLGALGHRRRRPLRGRRRPHLTRQPAGRRQLALVLHLPRHQPRRLLAKYRTMTVVTWTFVFGALGVLPVRRCATLMRARAARCRRRPGGASLYIVLFPTVGTYFLNALRARARAVVAGGDLHLPAAGGGRAAGAPGCSTSGRRPTPSSAAP